MAEAAIIANEKWCSDCERMLPLESFYRRVDADRPGQPLQHKCKECQSAYQIQRRREQKLRAIEYLGGKCSRCGYDRYPGALDLHHTDPEVKDHTIMRHLMARAWDKIRAELDKCVLLCANCHREEEGGCHS